MQTPVGYKAPQPVEVYILSDHANASIPPEIREQFQRDEHGRVLFFTAPPLNTSPTVQKEGRALGHSARYLAAKAARDAMKVAKRKADEADAVERAETAKKARVEAEKKFEKEVSELGIKAIHALENQLAQATKMDFDLLGVNGDMSKHLNYLTEAQKVAISRNLEREARLQKQRSETKVPVTGMTARLEENI